MNPQVSGKQHDGSAHHRPPPLLVVLIACMATSSSRKTTQQSTQLGVYGTIVAVANQLAGGILSTSVVQSADSAAPPREVVDLPRGAVMPAIDSAAALRGVVEATLSDFLAREAASLESADPALGALASLARSYVLTSGKRLRPTFGYWGWRGVAGLTPSLDAVLPALASLELLHAFALVQDDVMDSSATRRGRSTAHEVLAAEHSAAGRAGSAGRFGSTGAVLLGDLLLVWADRMQLQAKLPPAALLAARHHYDEMRIATIAGQYLDVLSDAESDTWSVERALRVARLKTAGYTVTGPLLLGAALADGQPHGSVAGAYTVYGEAVGEAFQLRDDLLGVFGDPLITGKPAGEDLRTGKPTVLLLLARQLATAAQRTALRELPDDAADVARLTDLVAETGAIDAVEAMVEHRINTALDALVGAPIDPAARSALADLAITATSRRA
jgi:geranylgeranyl diphosphate synthase, type I